MNRKQFEKSKKSAPMTKTTKKNSGKQNKLQDKLNNQKEISIDPDLQWLGHRIRIARILAGYSKSQDFKNVLFPNYTVSLYYQWEIGKRKPNIQVLKQISEFCKINLDWLITGEEDPFAGIKISPKEKELKKAMIAYELLTKKFEREKQKVKIPQKLSEKLFTFAAAIPAIEQKEISMAINLELFETIIQKLIEIYTSAKMPIPAKKFAKYAVQIYATIVKHEPEAKKQLNMVKIIIATYEQLITQK